MPAGTRTSSGVAARVAALALAVAALPSAAADMKFKPKECLDCHKKEADKYAAYKYAHAAVREKKCEECHLRHGLVPKLLLKESGNGACLRCHNRSGRIALSYQGLYDGNNALVPTRGGLPGPQMISGGRSLTRILPDVHHAAGIRFARNASLDTTPKIMSSTL